MSDESRLTADEVRAVVREAMILVTTAEIADATLQEAIATRVAEKLAGRYAAIERERDWWRASGDANHKELTSERDAARAEVKRLRKLFDDAGQGEHNVLALVDHYQDCNLEQRARIADLESQLAALSAELDQAHRAGAALAVRVRDLEGALGEALDHLVMAVEVSRNERVLDSYEANEEMCWIDEKRELLAKAEEPGDGHGQHVEDQEATP